MFKGFQRRRAATQKRKRARRNQQVESLIKAPHEIERLREANQMVAAIFAELEAAIQPGVRLDELDKLAEDYIRQHGAQTLYKGYRGNPPDNPPFPGVICASINHEICHGLPNKRRLKEGDIVGIDIGLRYRGYCGDACVTFPVGQVSAETQTLLNVARASLAAGISAAQPEARMGAIGEAIQTYAESRGFSVVREWGGHGIGKNLHEPPAVGHTGQATEGMWLKPGMVFTIEPMINLGQPAWRLLKDQWTVVTQDGSLSAQFEHTLAITQDGPEVLSTLPNQVPAW
jgi:methionyl aminopeptidase